MNTFIQTLMSEHQHALAQLSLLDDASARLAHSGYAERDLDVVRRAVTFINNDIRIHNEREEAHLFPELERVLPPAGPTAVMREEHRVLWEDLTALERTLDSVTGATGAEAFGSMHAAALGVVRLLRDHIMKEDNILFPMAERALSPEQLARLEETERERAASR